MLSQYIDVIHQSPYLGITHYTVTFPNNAVMKCYILNLGNLITATNINKIVTYVTNAVLKKRMRAKMSSKMFVLFIYWFYFLLFYIVKICTNIPQNYSRVISL